MTRQSLVLTAYILTIAFLILPTIQATEIELGTGCSLMDAISAANTDMVVDRCAAGHGADTILLSADVSLEKALPLVTSVITIEGGNFTIRGSQTHIIGVNQRGNLTLNEVTIIGGKSGWGGAIGNLGGKLTINNSTISNNSAGEGGAIGNEGTLTIINSEISNNDAVLGGAIQSLGGALSITSSVFSNNTAEDGGGALHILSGMASIVDSTFSRNNTTSGWNRGGGAIFNDAGTLSVTTSTFTNNRAAHEGGAIYVNDGDARIVKSSFDSNSASSGGALYNDEGPIHVSESNFLDNSASSSGGAIYDYYGANTIIENSTFQENEASEDGGAVAKARRSGTITHVTMVNNSANRGGGFYKSAEYDNSIGLFNSIIVGSKRGSDCYGRLDQNEGNLIEDGSCFASLSSAPMLRELVEPEDGSTAYYPLMPDSPAIDAAHAEFCIKTDQIGTMRPHGQACDIGAIEYFPGGEGN